VSRPDSPTSIYLDSCALIHVLTKHPGYEPAERLLRLADAGDVEILTSPMILVEVRGQGRKELDAARESEARALLDNPRFVFVEFDREVALKARDLVPRFGLKPADAIHLASAVLGEAEVFMTFDGGLPRGRDVDGVWVDEVYTHGGPDLFGE
jgi:predicted nucleic acid-binding protein